MTQAILYYGLVNFLDQALIPRSHLTTALAIVGATISKKA